MGNIQKEVQAKLAKGLLDLIILQFLSSQPMHTIYPLLATLEKKGFVNSEWNMKNERPRKIYKLTTDGQNILNFTENSLNLICQKIGANGTSKIEAEAGSTTSSFLKKNSFITTHAK